MSLTALVTVTLSTIGQVQYVGAVTGGLVTVGYHRSVVDDAGRLTLGRPVSSSGYE